MERKEQDVAEPLPSPIYTVYIFRIQKKAIEDKNHIEQRYHLNIRGNAEVNVGLSLAAIPAARVLTAEPKYRHRKINWRHSAEYEELWCPLFRQDLSGLNLGVPDTGIQPGEITGW